ncbi:FAD-dependent oxidoreductase [Pseudobacteriovorax antillogorgiicola]|uniref:Ferredoxin-NADP reductase n=1 Tax=Pseudobacteriovorax antillogorgiicola TaxID=1513793 RepID=A0A1Y6C230_9BACT|nr:FAD-dependent oxidoreductase [Pseudobacteriovorax antillogorgiicola]TCS50672.1 ferredoxin-NADP reductase [Pseudobacteriovorax antillogorgiicola]SMF40021.1 Ferredoxin-NADP reductase [Pseudobacteriovorax antillogorgiicola]
MAKSKSALVTNTVKINDRCQLVNLRLNNETEFSYAGGKYIIVNSGIEIAPEKTAKRAYSIIKKEGDNVLLSALQLKDGVGSQFINKLVVGDEVPFSGPWGKLTLQKDHSHHQIIATDTGISAALGLVTSNEIQPYLSKSKLFWFRPETNQFLSDNFVLETLPEGLGDVTIQSIAEINDEERQGQAQEIANHIHREAGTHYYLVGDGHMVLTIKDKLISLGVTEEQISMEIFFNKPAKP